MNLSQKYNPYFLETHGFHRDEMAKYGKSLFHIKTNTGKTLKRGFIAIWETIRYQIYLLFKNKFKKPTTVINSDIMQIRNTKELENAIIICKKMNILNEHTKIEDLSDELVGKILVLGFVFSYSSLGSKISD